MLYRLILLPLMGLPAAGATTFTVTSLDDSRVSCAATRTLRDAVTAANATPTAALINFLLAGDSPPKNSVHQRVIYDSNGAGEDIVNLGNRDLALTHLIGTSRQIDRFVVAMPVNTVPGRAITATADGRISEFSRCTLAAGADTLISNGWT